MEIDKRIIKALRKQSLDIVKCSICSIEVDVNQISKDQKLSYWLCKHVAVFISKAMDICKIQATIERNPTVIITFEKNKCETSIYKYGTKILRLDGAINLDTSKLEEEVETILMLQ